MKIFKKILEYLPFNKTSVYNKLEQIIKSNEEIKEKIKNLEKNNNNINQELNKINSEIYNSKNELNNLLSNLYEIKDIQNTNISNFETFTRTYENYKEQYRKMFFSLYKKENETYLDAKKRFFLNMEKAEGINKDIQNLELHLLKVLHKICLDNNILYFLWGGAVLGAIRHQGFIPWDDDIDIGMLRDDFKQFIDIMKDNNDYEVCIQYDAYVLSKQIRFKYKNTKNSVFIDIFLFDYVCSNDKNIEERKLELKRDLHNELLNMEDENIVEFHKLKYVREDSSLGLYLKAIFDKYIDLANKQKIICEKSTNILYSLDNWQNKKSYINDINSIFPTKLLKFEDIYVNVAADYTRMCEQIYGQIYDLPNGEKHFTHIDINDDFLEFLEKYKGINNFKI